MSKPEEREISLRAEENEPYEAPKLTKHENLKKITHDFILSGEEIPEWP